MQRRRWLMNSPPHTGRLLWMIEKPHCPISFRKYKSKFSLIKSISLTYRSARRDTPNAFTIFATFIHHSIDNLEDNTFFFSIYFFSKWNSNTLIRLLPYQWEMYYPSCLSPLSTRQSLSPQPPIKGKLSYKLKKSGGATITRDLTNRWTSRTSGSRFSK